MARCDPTSSHRTTLRPTSAGGLLPGPALPVQPEGWHEDRRRRHGLGDAPEAAPDAGGLPTCAVRSLRRDAAARARAAAGHAIVMPPSTIPSRIISGLLMICPPPVHSTGSKLGVTVEAGTDQLPRRIWSRGTWSTPWKTRRNCRVIGSQLPGGACFTPPPSSSSNRLMPAMANFRGQWGCLLHGGEATSQPQEHHKEDHKHQNRARDIHHGQVPT